MKQFLVIAGAVISGIAIFAGYHFANKTPTTTETPTSAVSVSTSNATHLHTTDRIFALGRVEGVTRGIALHSQIAGVTKSVPVKEGQQVDANAELVLLDSRQQQYEYELAVAAVRIAQSRLERLVSGAREQERTEAIALHNAKLARLNDALRRQERIRQLHEAEVVARHEREEIEAEVEHLTAEVQAAEAQMKVVQLGARAEDIRIAEAQVKAEQAKADLASLHLERMSIRAPFAGQVLRINVKPGELTGPDANEPAVIIADTSQLRVRAFVEELDAPRVAVGMTATVEASGLPGMKLAGTVTSVSPRMGKKLLWSDRPDEKRDTKTREVMISLVKSDQLFVGMQVDVIIQASQGQSAVR
ncbi:MAG: HlyD family efflux transporter periplasmic adaptor subunit [Planctomycetales bacterium]|nr:HlyD family efflux transporter periplasmic adaptor subunit [Planctomycetales bacterium]